MARKRPEGFDLRAAIARAEFTPAGSDVPALYALLLGDDEDAAKDATNALLRVADRAVLHGRALFAEASPEAASRIARLFGRLPADLVRADLVAWLGHADSRARRGAIGALGRIGGEGVEDALLASMPGSEPAETRALAAALGKVGTERSAAALAAIEPGDDAELARITTRARLMRDRDAARSTASGIRGDVAPGSPTTIELSCRDGLEALLLDELLEIRGVREPRLVGKGRVQARLAAPLSALDASRIALDVAFVLPETRVDDEVRAVVRLLDGPLAREILETFTEGRPRLRVDFPGLGPRRALTWDVAAALAERGLVNDSREAPWEARMRFGHDGVLRGTLVPRGREDRRFAYRRRDVPAASHPTIAAAIARLAGVRDDDVVWDPFVGSGAELIERATLGPCAALLGTDLDPDALAATRENLAAAELRAELVLADATTFVPPRRPTLVVSNPPMGRRVHRGDVAPLLERWLEHLVRVIARDARLVFVTPLPRRTTPVLERLGLRLERSLEVDMGGFSARLERWQR